MLPSPYRFYTTEYIGSVPLTTKVYYTEPTFSTSQLRKTGKVTQTSMFRTNKKGLIFMRFEQNDSTILILCLKITYTYFEFPLIIFLRSFPEIRGTGNSGSVLQYVLCTLKIYILTRHVDNNHYCRINIYFCLFVSCCIFVVQGK